MSQARENPLHMDRAGRHYAGHVALQDLSIELHPGQVMALLGPNGAGKSTAMSLMNGLALPDLGEVRVFGASPRALASRRRMGVMLQRAALPDSLGVGELVALAASYCPQRMEPARIRRLAGLEAIWSRRYGALSGGQQRAVQFALAICGRPSLLLLDEPSVGLDIAARSQMWTAVRQLAEEGCAVMLATHHLDEAEAAAEYVTVLRDGRALVQGRLDDLRRRMLQVEIRCRTQLVRDHVAGWPLVTDCRDLEGGRLSLRALRAEPLVAALLVADPDLDQLEVLRPTLADIFAEAVTQTSASRHMEAA